MDLPDFDLVIAQTVHIVNKRPVAFREFLRGDFSNEDEIPAPIIQELLIKGYDLVSVNVLPYVEVEEQWAPGDDLTGNVRKGCDELTRVRKHLLEINNSEFFPQLISQATNTKDRYKPVCHKVVCKGDIVLLKEANTKLINFPMGIVCEVIHNDLGEVTGVTVMKDLFVIK